MRRIFLVLQLCKLVLLGVLLACVFTPRADAVPREAQRHKLTLKREAQLIWGLQAPVAVFGAQVHQESRWRLDARSPVGAEGPAQFMPATSAWWCGREGTAPADCQPTNMTWALRALVGYDKFLFDRVTAANNCSRFAMMLSAYNGGLGWVYRDQAAALGKGLNKREWFGSVELVNAGRTAAAWQENRGYPKEILLTHTPLYTAAGWGEGVCP